jgi:hypothetical protein
LFTWLASYLSERIQVTKFGSELSDGLAVHGGVPEGNRIGPVAFIVHINCLPLVLKQPEINHGDVSEVSDDSDDDVTIFMVTQQSLKLSISKIIYQATPLGILKEI